MKGCLLLKGEDMKSGDVIDVNKRYRITCPYCGKIQYTCLSIAHMWGIANGGRGICLECKKAMTLVFDYEAELMTAKVETNLRFGGERHD